MQKLCLWLQPVGRRQPRHRCSRSAIPVPQRRSNSAPRHLLQYRRHKHFIEKKRKVLLRVEEFSQKGRALLVGRGLRLISPLDLLHVGPERVPDPVVNAHVVLDARLVQRAPKPVDRRPRKLGVLAPERAADRRPQSPQLVDVRQGRAVEHDRRRVPAASGGVPYGLAASVAEAHHGQLPVAGADAFVLFRDVGADGVEIFVDPVLRGGQRQPYGPGDEIGDLSSEGVGRDRPAVQRVGRRSSFLDDGGAQPEEFVYQNYRR
mmetsp:Transcript_26838/g.57071  ORF Transcript_26838/g.57071 Transcript_26838/m.57071 type:complete len:262 (-) Transcript_26838:212-997(-)